MDQACSAATATFNPSKTLKSINILLSEQELQVLKVYAACSSVTMRDLVTGVMRDWMESNRETIERVIGKISGQLGADQ